MELAVVLGLPVELRKYLIGDAEAVCPDQPIVSENAHSISAHRCKSPSA
jgi:hypothetical protein